MRNSEVEKAIEQHYDLIYIDEVMFTKHTYLDRTWSGPNDHLECDMRQLNMTPIACCVAVSE